MPPDLAAIHGLLWAEVAFLYQRWTTFKTLYTDPKTVELLNWAAAGFFQLHQRILLDDVLLGIGRLADKPTTGRQSNLTLRSLQAHLPTSPADLAERVANVILESESKAAFAIPIRHKRLAHRDEEVATGASSELDYRYENTHIEEALGAAAAVLNLLELQFEGRQTHFEGFIHAKGADTLLHRLGDAKKWHDHYFGRKLNEE
jgi:hypothetical protein